MTAREFLRSIKAAKVELRRCEWRLQRLTAQATSTTSRLSGMPGGGSGDKHKDAILLSLAEQSDKLEHLKADAEARIAKAGVLIESLDEPVYKLILELRYLDMMSWTELADELEVFGVSYGMDNLYKLHSKALDRAQDVWRGMEQNEDC